MTENQPDAKNANSNGALSTNGVVSSNGTAPSAGATLVRTNGAGATMVAPPPPEINPFITFADVFEEEEEINPYADPSLDRPMEALNTLPDLLHPSTPPPSAKERVMSHLQEPIVAIFVGAPMVAPPDPKISETNPEQWQLAGATMVAQPANNK